jgi:hypothetical protein
MLTMKKILLAAVLTCISLGLISCGHGSSSSDQIVTQILSDPTYDGEIEKDSVTGAYTITQGMSARVQSVFAGIDPVTGTEHRAFLDFPLTGSHGVPGNAVIVSAVLDFVINTLSPYPLIGTIPIRIDLVSFQPPSLLGTDFDRTIQPALATLSITPPISQSDFGQHVSVDVTSLMNEAQRSGLPDFQVRILEDLGVVSPGLIEINDTTGANQGSLAPLLQVTYY